MNLSLPMNLSQDLQNAEIGLAKFTKPALAELIKTTRGISGNHQKASPHGEIRPGKQVLRQPLCVTTQRHWIHHNFKVTLNYTTGPATVLTYSNPGPGPGVVWTPAGVSFTV